LRIEIVIRSHAHRKENSRVFHRTNRSGANPADH
jgi:hypothetical protein